MAGELKGRRALVTGVSRGIGAAIASRLARQGADVAITYVGNREAADRVVGALGPRGAAIQADAADAEAVRRDVDEAASRLGGLDVLVHNAGVAGIAPIGSADAAMFDRHFAVNVEAVFAGTTAALPHMPDGGRIILIGSVNAHTMPWQGGAIYGATKAAVAALARGWARDLGPRGILVNVVQPGPIDTDMNPADDCDAARMMTGLTALGRYGRPEESPPWWSSWRESAPPT